MKDVYIEMFYTDLYLVNWTNHVLKNRIIDEQLFKVLLCLFFERENRSSQSFEIILYWVQADGHDAKKIKNWL